MTGLGANSGTKISIGPVGRLGDLRQLGIVPELTGSLAAPLLAASQRQEMPLP